MDEKMAHDMETRFTVGLGICCRGLHNWNTVWVHSSIDV